MSEANEGSEDERSDVFRWTTERTRGRRLGRIEVRWVGVSEIFDFAIYGRSPIFRY
ncbi:hypothetical protein [Salinarchaeum chitinilyticum]